MAPVCQAVELRAMALGRISRGTRLGAIAPNAGPAKARATPVEHRLYYADYRDVNGLKLPFRLRRAIGADTTEETTFDRYQINGKIDPRRFQIVKYINFRFTNSGNDSTPFWESFA